MSELIKISLGSLALVANGLPVQGQAGVPTATATVVGSGAVSATVVVRGSNDGVAWVPLATLSPSGTGTGVASGTWSGDYAQLRADVTAISAGAVVSTAVSVDQTGQAVDSGLFISLAQLLDPIIDPPITRDANGAAISAALVWPDGATGAYTATQVSAAFPGAVDAYTCTRVVGGVTTTYTQPAVSRDASGVVIDKPQIIVS